MKDSRAAILDFWFVETRPAQWFQKNPDFDALIRERFGADYDLGIAGIYDSWAGEADGCLALCILFDQFPRNMFRETARAFATDERALDVAERALAARFDALLSVQKRRFLYLPFEHAEDLAHQDRSVALFEAMQKEDPTGYAYALRHRDVIARFGRFPHRNAALGRGSTPDEVAYLAGPDAGF
ncbi:MAG: DUF924 domain-containing protein [Rhodospirillales bacterium]|nr:DUF924 domain-containing protein [Alphaproteobacteria bacterium]MCB9987650.1 DUF924 domain-containing protein [Rhodospirillales bacterium]USO08051.1 MAG: DUF924 domain-containing protein [Rhodospirillales bacterium]